MDINATIESLAGARPDRWVVDGAGVTRSESVIPALVDRRAYGESPATFRLLIVGDLSGAPQDVNVALQVLEHLIGRADDMAGRVAISAVPCGNPEGLRLGVGPENGAGGFPATGYPPADGFFNDPRNPETRHLWRWITFLAPDLVLQVRASDSGAIWEANAAGSRFAPGLNAKTLGQDGSLLAALGQGSADAPGTVPGVRLTAPPSDAAEETDRLWKMVIGSSAVHSSARVALEQRAGRSRLEVCHDLASAHGRTLKPVRYTQGVAISGRLRMAMLEPETPNPPDDLVSLVEPFAADARLAVPDAGLTTGLGGLVWGDELTAATGDPRYAALTVKAADSYRSRGKGQAPEPTSPDFQVEDMFFTGMLLGRAFGITGKDDYIDIQTDFLINTETQQADGLFWHSRAAPYYWGRGNGFAAMGLTEALTFLPDDHPDSGKIVSMISRQMNAVRDLQAPSGMFRQVIDSPGAYQEFTCTCMIGYSIARGVRMGWLDRSLSEVATRAWRGVSERIDDKGNVVDACVGTGGQTSVRAYLDRPAASGFDDRSGSMALWFGTEMERLSREGPKP